ncbi:MAG: hypothetical protein B7X11_06185 [Acidobacteria bacterium 37-65-4]|nr:MAG: hypothetical protein B7X11_06185 [Acidobacteria bacterium 37-65-4]
MGLEGVPDRLQMFVRGLDASIPTAGYTDDAIARHGFLDAGTESFQKPFTPLRLMQKVREVLNA